MIYTAHPYFPQFWRLGHSSHEPQFRSVAELGSVMGKVGHGDAASTEHIITCPLPTQTAQNPCTCPGALGQSNLFYLLSSRFSWPTVPTPLIRKAPDLRERGSHQDQETNLLDEAQSLPDGMTLETPPSTFGSQLP